MKSIYVWLCCISSFFAANSGKNIYIFNPTIYENGHFLAVATEDPYYGSFIGTVSNKEQGIRGQLYSIDLSTVYLKNFTYQGSGSGSKTLLRISYPNSLLKMVFLSSCHFCLWGYVRRRWRVYQNWLSIEKHQRLDTKA